MLRNAGNGQEDHRHFKLKCGQVVSLDKKLMISQKVNEFDGSLAPQNHTVERPLDRSLKFRLDLQYSQRLHTILVTALQEDTRTGRTHFISV